MRRRPVEGPELPVTPIAIFPLLTWFLRSALRDPRAVLVGTLCLVAWPVFRLVLPLSITGSISSPAAPATELVFGASLAGALYGLDRCSAYRGVFWHLNGAHRLFMFSFIICGAALVPGYLACIFPICALRHDPGLLARLPALPWSCALPFTAVAVPIALLGFSRTSAALALVGLVWLVPAALPAASLVPGPSSIERLFDSMTIEPLSARLLPFAVPIMASAILLAVLPRHGRARA